MRGATIAIPVFCAMALGGCAGFDSGRPPSNHAYLDMYDRAPARARKARAARPSTTPAYTPTTTTVESPATVGSAAPAAKMKTYSPEWWAAEKARQDRENERMRRAMQICHAC
jgi:hypothetical protein